MTDSSTGMWRHLFGRKGKSSLAVTGRATPAHGDASSSRDGADPERLPATIYRQLLAADAGDPPDLLDSGPEAHYGWPKDLKFAPGAHDGITMRHMAPTTEAEADEFRAAFRPLILDALAVVADRERFTPSLLRLQEFVANQPMAKFVDIALATLAAERPNVEAVKVIGRVLAMGTCDREVVKFGLGVLMAATDTGSIDLIRVFGKHEEFAPYVIAALDRCADDPTAEMWKLAQRWTGWGRVHAVSYLSANADERPDLQRWLLRDGWRGDPIESLSYDCAVGGRLVQALARDDLDDAELDGCCCILESLTGSSAMPSISEYAQRAEALDALIHVLGHRCNSLLRASAVLSLLQWLRRPGESEGDAIPSEEARAAFVAGCESVLAGAPVTSLVEQAIARRQRDDIARATRLAEFASFDWWELGFAWLTDEPNLDFLAAELARTDDKSRAQRLLRVAEEASVFSLPADQARSNLPSPFDIHLRSYLDLVDRCDLKHDLLQASALRSGWLSNRKWAANRLTQIQADEWGPRTVAALRDADAEEANLELRASLGTLVAKLDALLT